MDEELDLSGVPLEVLLAEIKDRADSAVICVQVLSDDLGTDYRYSIDYFGDPLICQGLVSKAQVLISQDEDGPCDDGPRLFSVPSDN